MDTFPDSCFVLMGQAECTPEPLQPISTPRESDILSSDEIDAIEETTVGPAEKEAWHQQREGRITAVTILMKYPVDYCYSPGLLYCGLIKGTLDIRLPRVEAMCDT